MMLGLLLARAGIEVVVLEKHADFLRDFRGDTVHPSTLRVMDDLGLLDELLKLPHQKVHTLFGQFGQERVQLVDTSHLPVRTPYIAMMPQWDFLDFLADRGREYPKFVLLMQAAATGLVEEGGRVVGIEAKVDGVAREIRADLVVGADGRHSIVRERSGLKVQNLGAPMDVLWFRLSHKASDSDETMARFERGRFMVMIFRGDYWQCAYVIPKGSADEIKAAGIEKFRAIIAELVPYLDDRVAELGTVDDLKLLTVGVDRLEKWWRPGLLCIGDAAHTMSPVGGVGINMAIQDAVAAANILAEPLYENRLKDSDLAAVQARRLLPVRLTQAVQIAVQNGLIAPALAGTRPLRAPFAARLLNRFPILRRLPARLIGMGVRPERVTSPTRR